jgi:DNA-binding phage protein
MRHLDTLALYAALESRKATRNMSWRELAQELELKDHTLFTRLSKGQAPGVDTVLTLCGWLEVPIENFTRGEVPSWDSREAAISAIRRRLQAQPGMSEERAAAARAVLEAAREQLERRISPSKAAPA